MESPPPPPRLALDRCTSVEQAVEVFRSHNFFADGENSDSNYHFLIADASGKSVVVEYYRPGEVPPLSDPAISINIILIGSVFAWLPYYMQTIMMRMLSTRN